MPKVYNVLVPRFDFAGPCNVAFDLAHQAKNKGYYVRVLSLGGKVMRGDLDKFDEARTFTIGDIYKLRGILHTHCLRPDMIGGIMSCIGMCKVISTLHNYFLIDLGFDQSKWKVKIAWYFWRSAIESMSGAVCISNAMQRYYKSKLKKANLVTIYNARGAHFDTKPETMTWTGKFIEWVSLQKALGRSVLAFIGGLSERKNIYALVNEVACRDDTALVICGAGPLSVKVSHFLNSGNIRENILLLGFVTRPELVLEKTDALVLPSFAEGMPLVVLEAARLGKPSMLSNIAVHRELESHGLGVTFNHKNWRDFSEKLNNVLVSKHYSSDGLKRVFQSRFTIEQSFLDYEKLF